MSRHRIAAVLIAASAIALQARADDLGARLYVNHCAACHGREGEGDGPVATTLTLAMPNLRSLAARRGGVFPAVDVTAYVDGRTTPAAHGNREMPIWGDVFRGAERGTAERTARRRIAAVVDFIESLQSR